VGRFFVRVGRFVKNAYLTLRDLWLRRRFFFKKNFWVHLLLTVFALFFTQALISSISAVVFIFMLLLPITSILYLIAAQFSIKLYLTTSASEVEKLSDVEFQLSLANESIIPFPFLEANITLPREDAIRCESTKTRLSLISLGSYVIRRNIRFTYRGNYEIGIDTVYVYDLFRMFCWKININLFENIYVLPRHMVMPPRPPIEMSDSSSESVNRLQGSDRTEMNDIRQYMIGDPLRSIHWKLSSKSEELMVKQFTMNTKKHTFLICDTAWRYDAESPEFMKDINEYAIDGVVECALTIAGDIIRNEGTCTLLWFDSRSDIGVYGYDMKTSYDYEQAYPAFATSPITHTEDDMVSLVDYADDRPGAAYIFVTGRLDNTVSATLTGIAPTLSEQGGKGVEIYYYNPLEKIEGSARAAHSDEANACTAMLEHSSVSVLDGHFKPAIRSGV